jgi:hypothetical protein
VPCGGGRINETWCATFNPAEAPVRGGKLITFTMEIRFSHRLPERRCPSHGASHQPQPRPLLHAIQAVESIETQQSAMEQFIRSIS